MDYKTINIDVDTINVIDLIQKTEVVLFYIIIVLSVILLFVSIAVSLYIYIYKSCKKKEKNTNEIAYVKMKDIVGTKSKSIV